MMSDGFEGAVGGSEVNTSLPSAGGSEVNTSPSLAPPAESDGLEGAVGGSKVNTSLLPSPACGWL